MIRIPPFSGLTAFYAAVRRGTLTEAAKELNVSQPAVSRRIAALEQDLGSQLFDRNYKPARLTQNGLDLMDALRTSFGTIEKTTDDIRRSGGNNVIRISGGSGFIGLWLIPRLAELENAFPKINIRIVSQEYGEAERSGDIYIRFGLPATEERKETRLMGSWVFPVASPLYLARQHDPEKLDNMTLLTMEASRRDWYDWPSWFEAVGQMMPPRVRTHDFSSYAMLFNAALAGQGACLCWSGLLDSFLASGALEKLGEHRAQSERSYFISCRDSATARDDVLPIYDWIIAEAASSEFKDF